MSEHFLSSQELQTLKQLLNSQKESLAEELAESAKIATEGNQESASSEEIDRASNLELQFLQGRAIQRDVSMLKKIRQALSRIEDNSYGYCETCEKPIDFVRLQSRPTAQMCIICKELHEKRESQVR